MPKYSKEQLWELYKELPEELQEAIFSQKTADSIYDSCKKNGVEREEKISQISKNVGYVLIGLASPEEFKGILSKEIKLKKETAKKIYQKINDSVFFPVKGSLEKIYNIKIKIESKPENISLSKDIEKKPREKDIYREPIE